MRQSQQKSSAEMFKKPLWQTVWTLLEQSQGAHPSGKSQGNLFFLQGQGKVREFCKMVREILKSSKVSEKSGNFEIIF